MTPHSDSSKEVTLVESEHVRQFNLIDVVLINESRRNVPGGFEVAQPLGRERVDLVVVRLHFGYFSRSGRFT
jgi:hypothetical protein